MSEPLENAMQKIVQFAIDNCPPRLYSHLAMNKLAKMIAEVTCKRCGYSWYPRSPRKPSFCANKKCNSPYWDRPRRKEKAA